MENRAWMELQKILLQVYWQCINLPHFRLVEEGPDSSSHRKGGEKATHLDTYRKIMFLRFESAKALCKGLL